MFWLVLFKGIVHYLKKMWDIPGVNTASRFIIFKWSFFHFKGTLFFLIVVQNSCGKRRFKYIREIWS